jgi:hypothetical protein
MTGNEFDFDVVARGAFIDDLRSGGSYPKALFSVETITIRLNHVALNEYIMSLCQNCRECYPDGDEGEKQWQQHQAEKKELNIAWQKNIFDCLDLKIEEGKIPVIKEVQSEIFTIVYVARLL